MKLAIVSHQLSRAGGGIPSVIEPLSSNLALKMEMARIFGLEDYQWTAEKSSWRGAPAQAFPILGPKAIGYAPRLSQAIRRYMPDIVHTHGIWMYPSAAVANWSSGTRPYVVSPHGMLDDWALRQSRHKKMVARALFENRHLKGARCMHALNDEEFVAIRNFGLRVPVATIPNGIDIPNERATPEAPWAGDLESGSKVLLYLGRLHYKKNLQGLIQCLSELRKTNKLKGWKLVIVGWGQGGCEEDLSDMANSLGLSKDVLFLGPLFGNEKDAALRNSSAFILPSFSEGLPMAILEAWSYGLPVAMTSACNLSLGFEVGAAHEIPTDPQQMAGPLADFLSMSDFSLESMGQEGLSLVREKYSWDTVADAFFELYQWLLGGGSKPGFVSQ